VIFKVAEISLLAKEWYQKLFSLKDLNDSLGFTLFNKLYIGLIIKTEDPVS